MKNLHIAPVLAIFIAAAPASAQVTFKHITGEEAARAVRGNTLNSEFAEGKTFSMSIHKRTESGHVERHMDWDEVFMIQEGDELLNFGKAASNPRQESPGEFSGGTITDGKSVMLHAGDIVTMPAGMWHQHVLKTPRLRYVLIRTEKPRS